ncbi:hypothetical protein I4U23_026996 [Adineta vaga]|nr:hypothetical protein I4U23_026996 [Adineta vaga]
MKLDNGQCNMMFRLSIDRWYSYFSYRFRWTFFVKCFLCFVVFYLLNILTGVQYYLWSEKSFQNEYSLTMTKIDLTKLDEEYPEKILGVPKYILSNDFIIKNQYLCHKENVQINSEPHLLILVKSAIQNQQARQAIRMTWAKKDFLEKNSIKIAFVLGINEENFNVNEESKQYRDIIQIDKKDYYYYNSYKMVMMLRWINQYCTSKSSNDNLRNYVLFIDDDYYLDLNSLLTYLNKIDQDPRMTIEQRRTFLTGYVYQNSRPRRFLNDRWYISMNDYPYDRYPPYVTAGCFLMTRSNARLFHIASNYIRLFRFDDIYMGLLAYSMSIELIPNNQLFSSYSSSIVSLNNQTGIFSPWRRFFTNEIDMKSSLKPICLHGYRGKELIHVWNQLHSTNLTLPVIN